MNKTDYKNYVMARATKSKSVKNCFFAFVFGGGICTVGQLFKELFLYLSISERDAPTLASICLIIIAGVLTGFGVFDNIARLAGAGTLVPITGFANAITSPAMDTKSEGYIFGVGAKIFAIAGPVILYGLTAGVVYGFIYYFAGI